MGSRTQTLEQELSTSSELLFLFWAKMLLGQACGLPA